ncbi:DUF1295 domain-containing protein [Ornithinimicrobium sediminis]|uniref:DUF1295 domain-containing protein n=1 Tax=Ornithinimicrobium sediminis TaxID=2904603 RepID=UPI001E5A5F94|nr:DUF1295 domain-containing protein [Ornithinimicrobium sediminis]MCE0485309.1 DUF1295 domain-containing protein [Ornithinimicrobium sediminis]
MDWSGFLFVSGLSLLALALMQALTWVWSRKVGKLAVVDVVWGAGFVVVGVVALAAGSGDLTRRVLLAALVAVWGLRLSWHIYRRSQGKGEDPRYTELYGEKGPLEAALRVFGVQGLLQWVISMPLQASAAADATEGLWWVVLLLGVAVWATGLFFEAVGDAQLARFKADPDNKGKVMDQGLWAWTRHPNYFGDACVWWGLWLIALSAATWGTAWTVIAPLAMTHFLRNVSGARLLEKSMSQRPAFQEYMQRTAYFFPRPPRT